MEHDEDCAAEILRQPGCDRRQRLDPAGRGADDDDIAPSRTDGRLAHYASR
jgi:hypothetical protein